MTARRAVFLVQNGIGWGHIRRCLTIATALRERFPRWEVVFVVQSTSLKLLEAASFPILSLPFLYRLPDAASEHGYRSLLEGVLQSLAPSVVVEDTHPHAWFREMKALQNVPRVLVLRRVTPAGFEEMRRSGDLAWFDRILLPHDEADLLEIYPRGPAALLTRKGARFRSTGPIVHSPTELESLTVQKRYRNRSRQLVVVSAGAGGDHSSGEFVRRLFSGAAVAAERLSRIRPECHWLLVLGPYYRGPIPSETPYLSVIRYEPYLAALLQIADVAILRPGINSMYEALAGSARIVAIPAPSYMEGQREWMNQLRQLGGVWSLDIDSIADLSTLVETALDESPPKREKVSAGGAKAAAEIVAIGNRRFDSAHGKWDVHLVVLVRGDLPDKVERSIKTPFVSVLRPLAATPLFVNSDISVALAGAIDQLPAMEGVISPVLVVESGMQQLALLTMSGTGKLNSDCIVVPGILFAALELEARGAKYRLLREGTPGPTFLLLDARTVADRLCMRKIALLLNVCRSAGFSCVTARSCAKAAIDDVLLGRAAMTTAVNMHIS